jgi:hypothetical protein
MADRIGNAKRPETRSSRLAGKAQRGERANQWRGRG